MKNVTAFLLVMFCVTATFSQNNVEQKTKTENPPLYVKHLNLLTGEETPWELNTNSEGPKIATTPAFKGVTEFFNLDDKGLKSLDFVGKITENPGFPEETVVYTKNLNENDLTCATMINSAFALASGNEYRSVAQTPGLIHIASYNFIKNKTDYEHAFATDIYFFGADTTDFVNNLALIKLNRPLGVFTGWMGYGYHTDDDFYKETPFFITHLDLNDNGYELHKYAAKADIVYNDNFLFAPRQILTNGAPYYSESGAAHGILSHTAWTTDFSKYWNGATRITKEKYNIISTAISNDLPDQFDLLPLKLDLEPYNIKTGEKLEKLGLYVHNYSEATFSGQIKLHIYLSEDKSIDSTDIQLVSYTMDTQMTPLKFFHVGPSVPPEIPHTIKSGKYYAGVIVENIDAETGNNTTQGIDIDSLEIENIHASNYVSGQIVTSGESPVNGWCMLIHSGHSELHGMYDIAIVETDQKYEFKDIDAGKYIIVYIPENSNNHRNLPTYYNQTPYWQNATEIQLNGTDTVLNCNINRIELPALTGNKFISGYLSQSTVNKSAREDSLFFSNIAVVVQNAGDQSLIAFARPENSGYYSINNLAKGSYLITIDKTGFSLTSTHSVNFTDDDFGFTGVDFTFMPDSTIQATGNITYSDLLNDAAQFNVYPNPVNNSMHVITRFTDNDAEKQFLLTDVHGKRIYFVTTTKNEINIDMENMPSGVYFLTLITHLKSVTKKIIKK